jgi:signal-transduction protein with cAMP-binding, CBS, and nucleotidyltransferase domain
MNQSIRPVIKEIKKCSANTTVREAAQLMVRKNRSIIFVSQNDEIIGYINSNDLVKRILSISAESSKPVIEVMTSPVETISEDALLYEVLLMMKTKGVSHLAVTDSKNNIIGVIGIDDILELQQNALSFLINEIEIAEDINALVRIYKRVPVLVKALIESGNNTVSITKIITSVTDAIHKRVIQLSFEDIGQPPCKFAFMVMGSEGRGEQSLATDQDNAIIFEEVDHKLLESHNKYFLALGEAVSRDLHTIGYHYCRGEIMARNLKWTQPLSVWKNYFSEWINNSNPKDVLEAAIFFDFRFIFGEEDLVNELREHVNNVSDNKAIFFFHMAQSVLKFKPPLNIFGQIVSDGTDELILDLKKVLLPLTSFIRLYSIREKLHQTNSIKRLEELFSRKVIDKSSYEELKQTYDFVTYLRLKFQIESISLNEIPGNNINLNNLTRIEVIRLKRCLSEIAEMQTKVGFDFKGME